MSKRTGGLLLAVVLAALSTTALISYVHGVEEKAFAGAETVEVYVARDAIPAGMSGDAAVQRAAIERTAVPRKVVADGAIHSLDEIRGKVAQVTIMRGEQIVAARFTSPDESGTGLSIPEGRQAMAVEIDAPPGVAGYVQTGSHVSVIAHLNIADKGGSSNEPRAQFLLQDVPVLAVGRRIVVTAASGARDSARQQQTQATDKVLLTLAVAPAQAEKLAYALFEGDVYFTLLPQGAKPVTTTGRTRINEFR